MKKPEKDYDYEVEYPVDENVESYYGSCEYCNNCNGNNTSCGLFNK